MHLDAVLAPLAAIAVALPVTFLLSRRIFLGRSASALK
jgi:putative flippase GtrA